MDKAEPLHIEFELTTPNESTKTYFVVIEDTFFGMKDYECSLYMDPSKYIDPVVDLTYQSYDELYYNAEKVLLKIANDLKAISNEDVYAILYEMDERASFVSVEIARRKRLMRIIEQDINLEVTGELLEKI